MMTTDKQKQTAGSVDSMNPLTSSTKQQREIGAVGAPAGHMYAALQAHLGWDLQQFETVMHSLVTAGRLRKQGHLYFMAHKKSGT